MIRCGDPQSKEDIQSSDKAATVYMKGPFIYVAEQAKSKQTERKRGLLLWSDEIIRDLIKPNWSVKTDINLTAMLHMYQTLWVWLICFIFREIAQKRRHWKILEFSYFKVVFKCWCFIALKVMSLLGKRFIGFTVCVCVWGVYHLYGPVEASVVFSLKEIQVLNS